MWVYQNSNTELYHFGILGMKWGVRRYQNEDGTLTAKGRKRYGEDLDKNDKSRTNISKIALGEAKRRKDEAITAEEKGLAKSELRRAKQSMRGAKSTDKGEKLVRQGKTPLKEIGKGYVASILGSIAGQSMAPTNPTLAVLTSVGASAYMMKKSINAYRIAKYDTRSSHEEISGKEKYWGGENYERALKRGSSEKKKRKS